MLILLRFKIYRNSEIKQISEIVLFGGRRIEVGALHAIIFPKIVKHVGYAVQVHAAHLVCVLVAETIMKKDAMGGGDIKLLALTGAFLGWKLNVLCLLLACVIGIIVGAVLMKKRGASRAFPWGPSIAAAAWLTLLFGQPLLDWYLGLF